MFQGLVNGARGVVIGFNPKRKNYPVVKFVSGVERTIEPAKWIVKQAFGSDMVRTQVCCVRELYSTNDLSFDGFFGIYENIFITPLAI